MARIQEIMREGEEIRDELTLVDGDALHSLADLLFRGGDDLKYLPWIGGVEFDGIHLAMAEGIAALHHPRTAFGVVAGLEDQDILAGVLASHAGAAQQLRGLVAS